MPAPPGTTNYVLQAFNFSGAFTGTINVTATNTTPVEPASSANLVISEIMYHPADPTPTEITAGFTDQEMFEFIELQNISTTAAVNLTGVRFTDGIDYNFSDGAQLLPGARLTVASNRNAFLMRYPGDSSTLAAGEFLNATNLSNGGERIILPRVGGSVIKDFSYDDRFPWPESPDGLGPSLVLIAPTSNPDHANAENWRPSTANGGTPGTSDATTLTGDPNADPDGNGRGAFLDYAMGSTAPPPTLVLDTSAATATFTFTRDLAADDVPYTLEESGNLTQWVPSNAVKVSFLDNLNGTASETWQATVPIGDGIKRFMRLRVTKRQP